MLLLLLLLLLLPAAAAAAAAVAIVEAAAASVDDAAADDEHAATAIAVSGSMQIFHARSAVLKKSSYPQSHQRRSAPPACDAVALEPPCFTRHLVPAIMSQQRSPFPIAGLLSRIMRGRTSIGSFISSFRSSNIGASSSHRKGAAVQSRALCLRPRTSYGHWNISMFLMHLNQHMFHMSCVQTLVGRSVRFASKRSSRSGDGIASSQDSITARSLPSSASIVSSAPSSSSTSSTVEASAAPSTEAAATVDTPKKKKKVPAVADPSLVVSAAQSSPPPTSNCTAPIMPAIDVHHMSQQLSPTALPDVLIVRTPQHAEAVVRHIIATAAATKVKRAVMQATHQASNKEQMPALPVFAVDTETVGLNVKSKSKSTPVLWGQVLTMQAYAGPDFNFNPDPNGPTCSKLFVDCAEHDLLHSMRDFFLSRDVPKV
jgi:hypothetical protein